MTDSITHEFLRDGEKCSIVIPAKNESATIQSVIRDVLKVVPKAEVIVVDDGSSDSTACLAQEAGALVLSHPCSLGNGAAIKAGARMASREVLVFMDADGQHRPQDIPALLQAYAQGFHMVVGARKRESQAGGHRAIANFAFNWLASWMVGHPIDDLTSGFRVVNARRFRRFLYLLPNGFSYPTTSTMCFFRAGYPVAYVPIKVLPRQGKSHIRIFRDGLRFLMIIFKIGALYSPLKLFLPISFSFFCTGVGYYLYTYIYQHRFTNMSALLFSTAVLVLLIGVVSEQITMLNYRDSE